MVSDGSSPCSTESLTWGALTVKTQSLIVIAPTRPNIRAWEDLNLVTLYWAGKALGWQQANLLSSSMVLRFHLRLLDGPIQQGQKYHKYFNTRRKY